MDLSTCSPIEKTSKPANRNILAYMRRCLELAERGRGRVSPNPLVGCVITRKVSDSRYQVSGNEAAIIAEGWHQAFGSPHAEVLAIQQALHNQKPVVRDPEGSSDPERATKNQKLEHAVLYVNLEPCSHEGKTPPCTDAIIAAGIKTVVFGARDPLHGSAKVLKEHGIEVIGPVLEAECRHLNRGFFSIAEQGRPWVTLKKAVPRECVALLCGHCTTNVPRVPRLKITSAEQDSWSHARLRATHDAILVGSGTILADDPRLNVRYRATDPERVPQYTSILKTTLWNPRRVVLDPHNEVPPTAKVLSDEDAARTLVIREKLPIPDLLQCLKAEGITSVLIEGGPTVWNAFEQTGMYDELVMLVGRRRPCRSRP